MDRVGQALRSRHAGIVGLLFIDVDDFKAVNDTLGHAVGDRLLTDLAARLLSCLRSGDTAARIGGDEFAVVLEDLESVEEAEAIAARIRTAFATPVIVEGQEVNVDASIGIATNVAEPLEADLLLRRADLAMYWAKREGRARSALYAPHMHEQVRERRELEALLRGALDRGEFELHYQPMFDLRSEELVSAEALLRWRQPSRGLMAPGEFLTALEDTGEIVGVGRWVIREASRQLAEWRRELGDRAPHSISVNVSARQLQDPGLVRDVADALAAAALEPASLALELTESLLMEDTDATVRHLDALKELGLRLAVDDFGTGYSSLSYLHRFPVDILKIDRSFVARMGTDPRQASFVRAIISLGRSLGLETVAEGIETPVQLAALSALRCHVGQGFYFSGPLPAGAFAAQHIEPRTVARRSRPMAV
jgi:diguanylate cyclase (GGDEF)-like protein